MPMRRRLWLAAVMAMLGFPSADVTVAQTWAQPANLRSELSAGASQLLIVQSASWTSSTATADLWELQDGTWVRLSPQSHRVRLGRSGSKVTRREGDGSTPAGSFALVSALGVAGVSTTRLPYTRIERGMCWISDSRSPAYNTLVRRPRCGPLTEDLHRIARSGAYRRVIVTSYNTDPIVPGKGSAIFVHLHSMKNGKPTATSGCVSMTSAAMELLWTRVDPAKSPRIVIGPTTWLTTSG